MNDLIKRKIRTVPNWPKDGIMFRDITTLLNDAEGFKHTCLQLVEHYQEKEIDRIAGIESRGFIFASVLSYLMDKPMVLIRKPGKLPADTISEEYQLEYGSDQIEIHKDAFQKGEKILLVDDLLATGGTMKAACNLVEKMGGIVAGCAFVIDLPDLKGSEKLAGYEIFKLVDFEGE